jgi:hypothetical protein
MRNTIGIAFALLAPAVFGPANAQPQPMQDRVFTFQHTETVQNFQEVANLIHFITEIRDATADGIIADNAQKTLAVHGTAEQVELAGWLAKQLDQPVDQPLKSSVAPASPQYNGPTGDDVVRILYLPHTATVQDFQEIANAARTVSEVRRVFTYNAARAMAIRDTADRVAMVDWIAGELDQRSSATPGYTAPDYLVGRNDSIRVYRVANAKSVQDFQEIANNMRTMAEIRRMFTYNTGHAMAVRGTPEELGMADWLLKQLDKPGPQSQASEEFRVSGAADDVMRVFYLPSSQPVEAFQQSAKQIRTTLEIRRVFTYNALRALSVRGTESQLALAQHMIEEIGQ